MVPDRKPRGYWGVVPALGLVLAASLGQAQEQAQAPQDRPHAQEQPAQPTRLPIPIEIIESKEAAEARERSEAEAAQREKADLVAQQGMNAATRAMNEATQRMAFYSLLSTVLVGIGTALLIWTLCLTRQANKAARDAVAVTREIGERQVRAYLSIKEAKVHNIGPGREPRAHIAFINSGLSPAYKTNIISNLALTDEGEDPHTVKFTFKGERKPSYIDAGAGVTTWQNIVFRTPLTEEQVRNIIEGRQSFVAGGIVEYKTAFRQRRRLVFRIVLNRDVFDDKEFWIALNASYRNNRSN